MKCENKTIFNWANNTSEDPNGEDRNPAHISSREEESDHEDTEDEDEKLQEIKRCDSILGLEMKLISNTITEWERRLWPSNSHYR